MIGEHDPRFYGDRWAAIYDDEHVFLDPSAAVEFLAQSTEPGPGPVLELGIGTGRVAIPLARRGVEVHGVDVSESMIARLRSKPGGAAIQVTLCDMATLPCEDAYALVYLIYNTLSSLLTQERQVACFQSAARSLRPGGLFVLESYLPELARFRERGQCVSVLRLDGDRLRLSASRHDPPNQLVRSQIISFDSGGVAMHPLVIRYVWPSELDLMARLAGLRLKERWGGWAKEPFGPSSRNQIVVYELPCRAEE